MMAANIAESNEDGLVGNGQDLDLVPIATPLPIENGMTLPDELTYFGQYGLALVCAKMLEASARALAQQGADAADEAAWINGRPAGISFVDCAETLRLPAGPLKKVMLANPKRVMEALRTYVHEIPRAKELEGPEAAGIEIDAGLAEIYISRTQRVTQRG
jgi:hypothetical protein